MNILFQSSVSNMVTLSITFPTKRGICSGTGSHICLETTEVTKRPLVVFVNGLLFVNVTTSLWELESLMKLNDAAE